MQRREVLNTLAFAGATVPAAMLSEATAPSSRAATPATPHGLMFTHMEMLNADILQFIRET
jgi:hypothetical protein